MQQTDYLPPSTTCYNRDHSQWHVDFTFAAQFLVVRNLAIFTTDFRFGGGGGGGGGGA